MALLPVHRILFVNVKRSSRPRKKLGTVQCNVCDNWSHLTCYNLSKEEADKESYVFTCSKCAASDPVIDVGNANDDPVAESHPYPSTARIATRSRVPRTNADAGSNLCLCSRSSSCMICTEAR